MAEKYNICDIFNICNVISKRKIGTDKEVQTENNLYIRKVIKRKRSEEYITNEDKFNYKYDSDENELTNNINNDTDLEEQIKSRWNFLNFLRY
jgi:hypothetical protein